MSEKIRSPSCRDCLHYEACGGFAYGCYAAFPSDSTDSTDSTDSMLGIPDTLDEAEW